jgi:phosphatidylglycerophosphatase C
MLRAMKEKKILALFDFDGTISTRDTFIDFFEFDAGFFKFWVFAISHFPFALAKILGLYEAGELKELFFKKFLKGRSVEELDEKALEYTRKRLPRILKKSALDGIASHRETGSKIALVSASTTLWLKNFAIDNGMDIIATELEVEDGFYTGRISGKNCLGPQKVVRIKEKYDLSAFDEIFAYGDTKGDREMLEIADRKHFRFFN